MRRTRITHAEHVAAGDAEPAKRGRPRSADMRQRGVGSAWLAATRAVLLDVAKRSAPDDAQMLRDLARDVTALLVADTDRRARQAAAMQAAHGRVGATWGVAKPRFAYRITTTIGDKAPTIEQAATIEQVRDALGAATTNSARATMSQAGGQPVQRARMVDVPSKRLTAKRGVESVVKIVVVERYKLA